MAATLTASRVDATTKVACSDRKVTRPGGGALLDARELAAALGESERTIRTWRQAGVIPSIVVGYRTYRYTIEDVMAALEKRVV